MLWHVVSLATRGLLVRAGKDPISDLALIKVDARNDFSYVDIVDELPRVGDWVLAVGNPFGLGGTVSPQHGFGFLRGSHSN
jgi:hypothetical protein